MIPLFIIALIYALYASNPTPKVTTRVEPQKPHLSQPRMYRVLSTWRMCD